MKKFTLFILSLLTMALFMSCNPEVEDEETSAAFPGIIWYDTAHVNAVEELGLSVDTDEWSQDLFDNCSIDNYEDWEEFETTIQTAIDANNIVIAMGPYRDFFDDLTYKAFLDDAIYQLNKLRFVIVRAYELQAAAIDEETLEVVYPQGKKKAQDFYTTIAATITQQQAELATLSVE